MSMPSLDQMTLEDLKQLEKDVAKAIKSFENRKRREALNAVEAKAREMGFSLAELTNGAKPKAVAAAKYRHPENPNQTWSGRGRKPKWFVEALEAGASEESLLIS